MEMLISRSGKPAALLLCLLCILLLLPHAARASTTAEYQNAYQAFRSLAGDEKRAKFRSHWKQLEERFLAVFKRDPNGANAPKALFYAARVNEELGKRSFLASDFTTAADYYGRVVSRFPKHSWSDDSLYRRAELYYNNLNDPESALADLNTILKQYPKGDMFARARELHRRLSAEKAAAAKGSPPAKAAAASGQTQTKQAPQARPQPAPGVAPQAVPEPSRQSQPAIAGGLMELHEIRYQGSNEYTRIVLNVTGEVPYQYQILPEDKKLGLPYRLYVDLKGTALGSRVDSELTIADGILRRVRTGTPNPGVSRVVLDFEAVQKYTVFSLDNPYRIIIDVTSSKAAVADAAKPATSQKQPEPAKQATAAQAPPKSGAPAKKAEQPPAKQEPYAVPPGGKEQAGDLVKQLGLTVKTIMLDPGHGGKDPGAVAHGIQEKEYVLRVAKLVGDRLAKKGFTVLYTRTKDVFVPLEERTAMANVRKADMFISFHINAHRSASVVGLETYYLDLASSESAVRVAARENAVSEKRISDLQFILTDLMLNSKMQESKDLASLIQKNMVGRARTGGFSVKDNGVRSAPFYVLMGAKMPSVLVELGYCTNREEARRIQSDKYLEKLADGIVKGVDSYTRQLEKYAAM